MEVAARDPLEKLRDIERHRRALDAEMLEEITEGGWTIRGRPPDGLEFVDRWGNVRSDRMPVPATAG